MIEHTVSIGSVRVIEIQPESCETQDQNRWVLNFPLPNGCVLRVALSVPKFYLALLTVYIGTKASAAGSPLPSSADCYYAYLSLSMKVTCCLSFYNLLTFFVSHERLTILLVSSVAASHKVGSLEQ